MTIALPLKLPLKGATRIGIRDTVALSKGGNLDPLSSIFSASDVHSGYYPVSPAYCFKDVAGTIPCTADGDLIACRKPRYGGAPVLTQATDPLKPIFKNDGGGRWRADWDGLDDAMASALTVTVGVEHLIALAFSRAANAVADFVSVRTSSTNYCKVFGVATSQRLAGSFRAAAGTTYSAISNINDYPLATKQVVSSLMTASLIDIAKDNGAALTGAATPVTLTNTQILVSGVGTTWSDWGISVLNAATIPAGNRSSIVKALAALQGRTL